MSFVPYRSWYEHVDDRITILFPGSFKPMHIGHINLIARYAKHNEVKEVKVLIGPGVRDGIDQTLSVDIAKKLLSHLQNVSVEAVTYPSPVLTAYKYIETAEAGRYAMAGVDKDDDYKRVTKFVKDHKPTGKYHFTKPENVEVVELVMNNEPFYYEGRTDENEGKPISSSILRRDIANNDYKNFKTNYPGVVDRVTLNIFYILKPYINISI